MSLVLFSMHGSGIKVVVDVGLAEQDMTCVAKESADEAHRLRVTPKFPLFNYDSERRDAFLVSMKLLRSIS